MQHVRCVVFDAVGTLIHSAEPVEKTYASVGRRFGSTIDQLTVRRRFKSAFREALKSQHDLKTSEEDEHRFWADVVASVFTDTDHKTQTSILNELWQHFATPSAWRLYDDVVPTWNSIHELGIGIAIGSNFDSRLHAVMSGLTAGSHVATVFDSASVGFRKPAREFFLQLERSLHLEPKQLLMVGDNPLADVQGAIDSDWNAQLIDRAEHTSQATRSVTSLSQIFDMLAGSH
ncbi:MAG: HAD family hydrolase [Planctomycetales bacterium]|nr:HAD family hydrolase [Planctomycetales bacterium]